MKTILIISKRRKMDSGICQKCHTGSQRISLNLSHRAHILPLDISTQRFIFSRKVEKLLSPAEDEGPSIWSLLSAKYNRRPPSKSISPLCCFYNDCMLLQSFHLPGLTTDMKRNRRRREKNCNTVMDLCSQWKLDTGLYFLQLEEYCSFRCFWL